MDFSEFDTNTVHTNFLTDYLDGNLDNDELKSFSEYLKRNKKDREFAKKAKQGKKALEYLAKKMKGKAVKA